jgi:hypothetical protein
MLWLVMHTYLQFSDRESILRAEPSHIDVRLNFKHSLFSMFMYFSGQQGEKPMVFGITHPDRGRIQILIFVSCLRLDLPNHTVVLDCALLPLEDRLMPHIGRIFGALALSAVGICQIQVNDDELTLWKENLPVIVERCRQ